jgi:hypothetical protein
MDDYKPKMYQSKLANRWVNLMRRLYRWLDKDQEKSKEGSESNG